MDVPQAPFDFPSLRFGLRDVWGNGALGETFFRSASGSGMLREMARWARLSFALLRAQGCLGKWRAGRDFPSLCFGLRDASGNGALGGTFLRCASGSGMFAEMVVLQFYSYG